MSRNIYDMELHEIDTVGDMGNIVVMRVPGGWIYTISSISFASSSFVPFHDGFQKEQ